MYRPGWENEVTATPRQVSPISPANKYSLPRETAVAQIEFAIRYRWSKLFKLVNVAMCDREVRNESSNRSCLLVYAIYFSDGALPHAPTIPVMLTCTRG